MSYCIAQTEEDVVSKQTKDGEQIACTCDVTARRIEYPNGIGRNLGTPSCMSPNCPVGLGNIVLAEQEAAEYEAYLDGMVVYGDER